MQLRQYALALENPPLLIVSDMVRFRIRTNWTNSVSRTYEFDLDDLADAATRDRLKWAFSDPERLRPGETRQALTEQAAKSFATVAESLRERGHDPHAVAHFVNRLVFCMFAEDVGLLPGHMFTRMLEQARRTPADFADLAGVLFGVMAFGGRVGFETVDWFNGGMFDDDKALPLEKSDIDTVLAAAKLDWSEIDPSVLGTLFERGLDPAKRAQLGQLPISCPAGAQGPRTPGAVRGGGARLPAGVPRDRTRQRQGHRDQPLRGRVGARVGVDR